MIIKEQSTYGIQTKYLGATNTEGARIKAFTLNAHDSVGTGRIYTVTLPYDYALSGSAVYEPAMRKLHDKISHNPDIDRHQQKECNHIAISSCTKEGGYFFTFLDDNSNNLFDYTE